ncbi:MAG: hypothetical protein ACYTHJ_17875, partial [Planctomycetota bacterium]
MRNSFHETIVQAVAVTVLTGLAVSARAQNCDISVTSSIGTDFRQASNENPTLGDIVWLNSILQQNNSRYLEGMSVAQRIIFILDPDSPTEGNVHTLDFNHQATKGTIHAYDFLTSYDQGVAAANLIAPGEGLLANLIVDACEANIGPQASTAICNALRSGGNTFDVTIPDTMGSVAGDNVDSRISAYELSLGDRTLTIYGNAPITAGSLTFHGFTGGTAEYAEYTLTWTSSSDQILIEVAGHLAVGPDNAVGPGIGYGVGRGASAISGGPYHFRLTTLDGASLGSQDNQIKGADILLPFCIPDACNDNDECTTDICDEATDTCSHEAISCDDGNACTADSCDPATGCVNKPISCDDNDECTEDSCNPATGCVNDAIDCDDGNACTADS